MRILLTGVSGFIGRYVLRALTPRHDVICVVRDGTQRVDGAEQIAWDFSTHATPALPERVDAIIHAAQSRRYRDFPDAAVDAFQVNVASTVLLASYAGRAKVRNFCLLSSGSVYEPYRGRLHEDAALAPTSLNGTTKHAAETLLAPYAQTMHVAALRLFFPYGPGQTGRLIPDLIERVRAGAPITLAGRQGLTLAPIYVEDIARIVQRAVEDAWAGPINVAGQTPITLARVVRDIARSMGAHPTLQRTPARAARVVPDISRLRERVNVESFVSWESGLSKTLAYHPDTPHSEPARDD